MGESFVSASSQAKEKKQTFILRRPGLILGTTLAAAAIVACGGGDSKASTNTSTEGVNYGEITTATSTPPVSLIETKSPPITNGNPEAAPEYLAVRIADLPPGRAIIAFAGQVLKPKYIPNLTNITNGRVINEVTKPIADKQYPNYARSVKVGGDELVFAVEARSGISTAEYISKDRYKQADGSEKAATNMVKEFFKVPEDGKFARIDYGKGLLGYELVLNKTEDFLVSLFVYSAPDIPNSTPDASLSVLRIGACAVPSASEQYARNSCLAKPNQ